MRNYALKVMTLRIAFATGLVLTSLAFTWLLGQAPSVSYPATLTPAQSAAQAAILAERSVQALYGADGKVVAYVTKDSQGGNHFTFFKPHWVNEDGTAKLTDAIKATVALADTIPAPWWMPWQEQVQALAVNGFVLTTVVLTLAAMITALLVPLLMAADSRPWRMWSIWTGGGNVVAISVAYWQVPKDFLILACVFYPLWVSAVWAVCSVPLLALRVVGRPRERPTPPPPGFRLHLVGEDDKKAA